jgi:outer membrane protein assembly factor BamB
VTFTGDVLFVGNDAGTLYAINPATAATLSSYAATSVIGSPILMTNSSPYTVVFSGGTGGTTLTAIKFDRSTNTFTTTGAGTWSTAMPGGCAPSAPIGFPGLSKIYVGCDDGNLYQFDAATGTNDGFRLLRAGYGVGDPTLDVELSRIMAGCTNSRVFAFTFPF